MSVAQMGAAFIEGQRCPHELARLAPRSSWDPSETQRSPYAARVDTQIPGDRLGPFPGEISPDRVVKVEHGVSGGHVYNLSTETGWFTAEGIIVHNCGTYMGGTALFFADVLDLIGDGRVISIDVTDWSMRGGLPEHERITYARGSSTDQTLVGDVHALVDGATCLAVLDSEHSEHHVLAELDAYAPLVTVGSYVIVEDTNVHEVQPDYPPGPDDAVRKWLPDHPEFIVDESCEKLLLTAAPGGFLRRVR